jgi:ABC-type lipoprotein release transport system permease subunit
MAVGASAHAVVALLVRHTMAAVALGVAAGTAVALATSRLLAPYLFGVTAHDPGTYAAILVFLTAVCVVASWLPARRAGRVAPAVVLRGE